MELIIENKKPPTQEELMLKQVSTLVKGFEIKFAALLDECHSNKKLSQKGRYNLANGIQVSCLFAAARLLRPANEQKAVDFIIKRNLETFERIMRMVYKVLPEQSAVAVSQPTITQENMQKTAEL